MTLERTPEHVTSALATQRRALDASCAGYDAGKKWEALRLASVVWILVADSGHQRSILTQASLKASLKFASTSRVGAMDEATAHLMPAHWPKNRRNMMEETPLVQISMGPAGVFYEPHRDGSKPFSKWVTFDQWWQTELIYTSGVNNGIEDEFTLTRKQLVASLRDQEGGAHFDAKLTNPNYIKFAHDELPTGGPSSRPLFRMADRELASMRQIAWEVNRSLTEYDKAG